MKYFIKTLGCAMNISDSERLASFLEDRDFDLAEKIDSAELIVFNTCGIRQAAENRVYSLINNIRKNEPKTKKLKTIVVTGCLAHREDVQKRLKDKVDLFTEIKNFEKEFLCHLERNESDKSRMNAVERSEPRFFDFEIPSFGRALYAQNDNSRDYLSITPKYTNNFQAYVPIMTGCDNFCSYCVVPYARGREVSRPAEEIIAEIKSLIKKGYKQITLLGQNVNSYKSPTLVSSSSGRGRRVITTGEGEIDFAKLLKTLDKIPGKFWLSFVSSHPKDMSDELIETIAKSKKVCEWVHLPVQAGDDEVLRRMNRKYTQKHFLGRINKIRKTFAKIRGKSVLISVSSDIIVGFPGETKKQFLQSALVMQKAKFDMVFFGQFSPRPGTVAWKMKDDVSNEEKEKREFQLNEILKKTALANNKKYVGTIQEILIEKIKVEPSPEGSTFGYVYFGKTRTQKNVKILSKKKGLVGKFTRALITKANIWNLEGAIK